MGRLSPRERSTLHRLLVAAGADDMAAGADDMAAGADDMAAGADDEAPAGSRSP